MAISVKQFKNLLDCPEPQYEINIAYHADAATGGSEICNGNGTLTNVYGDFASLADLYANAATGNAATTDICDEGMDVVFVVDYTASMGGAINGVKTGIAQIAQEIDTQTSGNYRLGLVLYDEYAISGSSTSTDIRYAPSGFYQNLPSDQKLIETQTTSINRKQVYTCIEKMDVIGNIGDASSGFTQGLNAINASSNSSTGMMLGNGISGPEPGGVASYKAAADAFAGQWRSGVLKLIIHITDNYPGGTDDYYNSTDVQYFQTTLTNTLDNSNIQFFHNSSNAATHGSNSTTYKYLVENTTPAGLGNYNVNYNSTWYNAIITGIQTLCDETTKYTCDPAPAGWYADVPIVAGTTVAYYWDGSAWTNSYSCPPPEYTVRLDVVDAITNGSVDPFPPNQAYQYDSDTFEYGPAVAGTVYTSTIQCSVDSGYENLSLNVSNVSDTAVVTSTSVNNGTMEVTVQVTIGNSDSTESIQINGTASQIQYRLDLTFTESINSTNYTPTGTAYLSAVTPASGWTASGTGAPSQPSTLSRSFTGIAGSTVTIELVGNPNPSDYTVSFGGYSVQNPSPSSLNALLSNAIAPGLVGDTLSFSFQMPAYNGSATVELVGVSEQPEYRYTLYASETITGASITGDLGEIYTGYTGDQFTFSTTVGADTDYENVNVTGAILNTAYTGNAAISNLSTSNSPAGAGCTVTMPSGGGSGGFIIQGTADQTEYDYVITINDSFSQASWGQVTLTGPAGSTPSTTATSINNAGYTFNATGITGGEPGVLNASISNATSMALALSLQSMPSGGGSATITVNGSQAAIQYTYDLDIETDAVVLGSFASDSITLTGTVGQVITGTFTFNQASDTTYSSSGHSSSDTAITNASYTGVNQLFSTNYTVEMPLGGGSGTITCDNATSTPTQYTYNIHFDDSQLSNSGNMSLTQSDPQVITGAAGSQTNFTWTLNPSPSYYNINVTLGNITVHDGSGVPGSASELAIGAVAGNLNIYGTLTMPSGGGDGYVRPKGAVQNPTFRFTLNGATQIGNTSIASPTQVAFDGVVGDTFSHTFDVVPSSGYTHDVTGVNVSNNYNNSLTASPTLSEDMTANLTMPVNGGTATVTATGTSQQNVVALTITFDEEETISNEGAWDDASVTFTGLPGSQHTIDNYWRLPSTRRFTSASSTSLDVSGATGNGNAYPGTDPFGGTLATSTPTNGQDARTTGTLTMPQGGGSYTIEMNTSRIEDVVVEYTLSYDKNDTNATGTTPSTTGTIPLTVANNGFENDGYRFVEWNTGSGSGSGVAYDEGDSYSTAANDILYAQWAACDCDFNMSAPSPTVGSTTTIQIIVLDTCIPSYSWEHNGNTITPVSTGALTYEIRNVSAGLHNVTLTDSNGCSHTETMIIRAQTTTTQATNYYYHSVRDCNDSSQSYIARSTDSNVGRFQIWSVGLAPPGGPAGVLIMSANIPEPSGGHDLTIMNQIADCPEDTGEEQF